MKCFVLIAAVQSCVFRIFKEYNGSHEPQSLLLQSSKAVADLAPAILQVVGQVRRLEVAPPKPVLPKPSNRFDDPLPCGASKPGDIGCLPGYRRPNCRIEVMARKIRELPLRSRVLREIIICPTGTDPGKFCEVLSERLSAARGISANFIAFTAHRADGWNHIHIAHDCTYTNSSCRCAWIQPFRQKGLPGTGKPYVGGRSKGDLRVITGDECKQPDSTFLPNLLQYYVGHGKESGSIFIGGVIRRIPSGCPADPSQPAEASREEGLLAGCSDARTDVDLTLRPDQLYLRKDDEPEGGTSEVRRRGDESAVDKSSRKAKRFRYGFSEFIVDDVLALLDEYVCSPPENIVNCGVWLDHPTLCNYTMSEKEVQRGFDRYLSKINRKTISELEQYHNEKTRMLLYENKGNKHGTPMGLYNREESCHYACIFLKSIFPMPTEEETFSKVQQFLTNVVDVVDQRIPKKNTIDVWGPPSCGKTWFFNMVTDYCMNVGYMLNLTRDTSRFALENCVNRKLIVWNEPQVAEGFQERLKTILGGDRTYTEVKGRRGAHILRTGVIITCNARVYPEDEAINTRRFCYEWNPPLCDFAEIGSKHLLGIAFTDVLNHFNVTY